MIFLAVGSAKKLVDETERTARAVKDRTVGQQETRPLRKRDDSIILALLYVYI
jgi:hypothetical protein